MKVACVVLALVGACVSSGPVALPTPSDPPQPAPDAGTTDAGSSSDAGTPGDGGTASRSPLPRISTGRPSFASEGSAAALVDGAYRDPNAWVFDPANCSPARPCWAAVHLGAGPTQILVDWSFEDGGGDFDTRVYGGPTVHDYSLQVSADSTDGADGTWTTAVDVKANPFIHRAHVIPFAGASWVRMSITESTARSIDELDVWDASNGTADTWFFHGDSITHRCANLRGTAPGYAQQPSFQALVQDAEPERYPEQIGGGIVGQSTGDAAREIGAYLQAFPFVRHWVLPMGTNDLCHDPLTYKANAQAWIQAVRAAGGVPHLVHPIWANGNTSYCAAGEPAFVTVVDDLVRDNGLLPPVPLYEATRGHPEYFDPGDVHPNPLGCAVWRRTFAGSLGGLAP